MVNPKGARRVVGLDLGSSAIKVVELEASAKGPRLLKSLIQDLPDPSSDRASWLQAALKEFDAREVIISISGPDVAIRLVLVPLMSLAELPEAVKWQIKEQVPFPVQDAVLDLRVLGEVWDKDI